MIISESVERYDIIKNYIDELGYKIKLTHYKNTNRWFYLYILNDKVNKIELKIEKEVEEDCILTKRKKNNIIIEQL